MERPDLAALIGVLAPAPLLAAGPVELDEDGVHHLRVRRAEVGAAVRVTDGRGALGTGRVVRLAKRAATVDVDQVTRVEPPAPVRLLVPVADRDRMLLLAEKAVELGLAAWQPVVWRRSLSVAPRGEGESFRAKLLARMAAALLQSGGAWLPEVLGERPLAEVEPADAGASVLLDVGGLPLLALREAADAGPLRVAIGPEGGVEPEERERLVALGFRAASLGPRVLRFETAAIVALGVVQAARLAASHAASRAASQAPVGAAATSLTASTDAP